MPEVPFGESHVRQSNRWIESLIRNRRDFEALPGVAKPGFYNGTLERVFIMKASIKKVLFAVGVAAISASSFAQSTDPGVAAITALSAQATTYITAAFAVAVLVAGGFWGIKMMKKAFSKAG